MGLILPFLFWLGVLGAYASIPSETGRGALLLGATILFFVYVRSRFSRPKQLQNTFVLITGFLLFASLWSVNFFFTPAWWLFLVVYSVLSFLLFYSSFYTILGREQVFIFSLLSTLVLLETAWALLFWPVHFITQAVVSFSAFYLIYMISDMYVAGQLEKNRVLFQVGMVGALLTFVLIGSPWGL